MAYQTINNLRIFRALTNLSDQIWREVNTWPVFAKTTIGSQLVRSMDSVCANLVEADGRFHYRERLNFFYVARGSLREAQQWVDTAMRRQVLTRERGRGWIQEIDQLLPQLNSYIAFSKRKVSTVVRSS